MLKRRIIIITIIFLLVCPLIILFQIERNSNKNHNVQIKKVLMNCVLQKEYDIEDSKHISLKLRKSLCNFFDNCQDLLTPRNEKNTKIEGIKIDPSKKRGVLDIYVVDLMSDNYLKVYYELEDENVIIYKIKYREDAEEVVVEE